MKKIFKIGISYIIYLFITSYKNTRPHQSRQYGDP